MTGGFCTPRSPTLGKAMDHLFLAALVAFLAAVMLTWLVRHLARALGVMDRPDGVRKLHRQPIPLMGGVAVFGGWLIGSLVSGGVVGGGVVSGDHSPLTTRYLLLANGFGGALFLAAIVVIVSGVLDDIFTLRPRWKLVGQSLA